MATLKVSGVSVSQVDAWDAARGFESFASWARRALDAAAADGVAGRLAEAGFRPLPEDKSVMVRDEEHRFTPEQAATVARDLATSMPDRPSSGARSQMCVHRVPAGTWCKRCGS